MILRRLVLSATSNSNLTRTQPLSVSATRLVSSSPDRYTPSGYDAKLARLTHKDWLVPHLSSIL
ncbi:hypothetical protein F2Q69_00000924 [Brassica cretica]|uniref:Uncharacterized protein n=1 Tax=Brassica cretica TaxID=69181 RepID=A0A8S9PQC8_BRACR|nr:hypothetical protein F2Q69_00000924 [Brassica cretica]